MYFEILVEDQSGKKALDVLVPKIIGDGHDVRIIPFKGIGHLPKNMKSNNDPKMKTLLGKLPRLLQAYGKEYANCPAAVIVVCDLDNRCLKNFRQELLAILGECDPKPVTRFCIAIEEGEAWFLGDLSALWLAYPKAKNSVLKDYINDSICDTWEKLADAVYPGGSDKLSKLGGSAIGAEKSKWAEAIAPNMDVENNQSGSFCYFRDKLRELANSDND